MDKIRRLMKNRIYIPEAVWSLAFALMTVLSRHTVYSDAVEANILTVYVSPFKAPDIVIFPLTAVAAYLCLQLIKYLFGNALECALGNCFSLIIGNKGVGCLCTARDVGRDCGRCFGAYWKQGYIGFVLRQNTVDNRRFTS